MIYELVFDPLPGVSFKAEHATWQHARAEAFRVLNEIVDTQPGNLLPTARVYGPGCGRSGVDVVLRGMTLTNVSDKPTRFSVTLRHVNEKRNG